VRKKLLLHLAILLFLSVALCLGAQNNYLLFHSIVEFSSIVVFLFIGFLGFFASRMTPEPFLIALSCIYLCTAFLSTVHTLSYHGMGILPWWTANHSTQLWVLMRYVHGSGLLAAALFSSLQWFRQRFCITCIFVSLAGTVAIAFGFFPDCFIPGRGLTVFKIFSEYAAMAMISAAILVTLRNRCEDAKENGYALQWALACSVASGFAFTIYDDVYGVWNMVGHILYGYSAYILLTGVLFGSSRKLMDLHYAELNEKIREMNRNLEHRVKERTAELEEANRAKSVFLATISHEVRTPLNGILGMAEYLKDDSVPPDERREYLEVISHSGESLLEILNNVIDLSRIESGTQELDMAPFRPVETAAEVESRFRERAEEKGIELETFVDPAVPPVLIGDGGRIRQVLVNLVGNGVKFTEKGKVSFALEYAGREEEHVYLKIRVRDTGIGIPEDARSKLFTPFSQSDGSIRRRHGGTGLGVALSSRIVALMGGELTFSTEEGKGTEFSFTLLLQEGGVGLKNDASSPEPSAMPQELSVLIVEDNPVNRMILENQLQREGWTVKSAESAMDAASAVSAEKFDLVFMDLEMPGMDGYQATVEIRRIEREAGRSPVPVVALTAHEGEEFRKKAEEAGMAYFITKPVGRRKLLRCVSSLFRKETGDEEKADEEQGKTKIGEQDTERKRRK